jgi:hypothetical protein
MYSTQLVGFHLQCRRIRARMPVAKQFLNFSKSERDMLEPDTMMLADKQFLYKNDAVGWKNHNDEFNAQRRRLHRWIDRFKKLCSGGGGGDLTPSWVASRRGIIIGATALTAAGGLAVGREIAEMIDPTVTTEEDGSLLGGEAAIAIP